MIKIMQYGVVSAEEIFARTEPTFDVSGIVSDIIENGKENGDKALLEYCEKFDKAKLDTLEVSEAEIEEAFSLVEPRFIEILKEAAKNITAFHKNQVRNSFIVRKSHTCVA